MLNSMETSHFSYSQPSSYFTQFSLHQNFESDSDFVDSNIRILPELHTVQDNNSHSHNNYYQTNSEESEIYSYNSQSVMSQPTQLPLPTQFAADITPFVHNNYESNTYIGTVNETAGSCITNEAVNALKADPSTTDDWTLTILGGPDHGKVIVAQQCPWAADVNIINPPTVNPLGDICIGELNQPWNEHTETYPCFSTYLNYDPCDYVNTDENIKIYRVEESEQPSIRYEIGGGGDGKEFTLESETWDSNRFDVVADYKENIINDANSRQLYAPEQSKFDNENELNNNGNNNTYPLTESNQKKSAKPTYKCDPCNKTFTAKCYLTQHNNSIHSESNLFKCGICGKRFANADVLNKHVTRHSGDKPKKCSMCSKSFNHKIDLERHIVLHTGTKPHTCGICGMGFVRNDHMLKHMETHKKRTARHGPSKASK